MSRADVVQCMIWGGFGSVNTEMCAASKILYRESCAEVESGKSIH